MPSNTGPLVGEYLYIPAEESLRGPRIVLTPALARAIVDLAHLAAVDVPTVLRDGAIAPKPIREGDVAADVYAYSLKVPDPANPGQFRFDPLGKGHAYVVRPRSRQTFGIGVKVALPPGYKITVESRSGLASNHGIEVGAGLIDNNYHEEIGVVIHNHTDEIFKIHLGDRIAQICVERYVKPLFTAVESLPDSVRTGGWGSSGMQ